VSASTTWNGLRLDVPSGWEASERDDTLALFPQGTLPLIESGVPVDFVYFACEPAAGADVHAIAQRRLERRVRQGEVEIVDATFAGLSGVAFTWSDGVSRVDSWLVVHRDWVLDVQLAEPWIRTVGEGSLADDARRICASVRAGEPLPKDPGPGT